jgi:hypothetical protein
MKKPKVFIVILNYFGIDDTKECLESLRSINRRGVELGVVLVNAVDEGREQKPNQGRKLKKLFPEINLVESDNLGFAGAHNVGIREALGLGADEVVILNNDTIVSKEFLVKLRKPLKKKEIGMVAPKIYFSKGREFHYKDYKESERGKVIWYAGGLIDWDNMYGHHRGVDEVDHGQFDEVEETDFATGCCIALRRDVLEEIGLLDAKTFLYYEDLDWSVRTRRAGYKVMFNPESVIWHKNAGSTKGSGSDLHVYYQTRNRFHYGLKYAPIRTKIALIRESIKKLLSKNKVEAKAIKDSISFRFGKQEI